MADDSRSQLESLDRASAAFRQMASDLDNINKKAKDASGTSGGFKNLDAVFGGLKDKLLGPIGLAAAFYGVAKSMESVAESSVKLQAFARNTGFAASNVENMQQAMRRMGMGMQEANQAIGAIGGKLQNLAVFKEGSELWQALSRNPGGVEFANRLKGLAEAGLKAGNMMGAFNEVIRTFNNQSPATKIALSQTFGVAVATLEDYSEAAKRGIHIWELSADEAKKYHNMWVDFEVQFHNIWTNVSNHGIEGINKLTEAFKSQGISAKTVADSINHEIDGVLAGIKTSVEEFERIQKFYDKVRDENQKGFNERDDKGNKKNPFDKLKSKSYYDDPFPFNDPLTSEKVTKLSPQDHNVLQGIWDTLRSMYVSPDVTGNTFGTGARGGHLQAGLGGFRRSGLGGGSGGTPGVGSVKIGKGGDPRGMESYIRETAAKYGVDPDTAVAVAKSEGLGSFSGDNGTSFGAFQLHTGGGLGDTFKRQTGLDPSDPANERATIDFALKNVGKTGWGPYHGAANSGIGPRAGLGGASPGDAARPPSGGGGGVPSAVLAEARSVAQLGGAGAVKQYITSKGFHVDDNWCGDFAAAVVKGSGGTPPKGYPIASNWRNWGNPVEGDPQPGDVAIRKSGRGGYVSTGSTGSHVNIVNSFDPETGQFRAIGGNQSSIVAGGFRRGQFDFRRGDDDRARLDRAQSQSGAISGNINASVDFKNVPNGVSTKASTDGEVFKQLQISRTKQAGTFGVPPPVQGFE